MAIRALGGNSEADEDGQSAPLAAGTCQRRWREALKVFQEATPESPPKPSPDDMSAAISDAQERIAVTPARTIAGVLVKLRLYADLNGRAFSTDRDCGQSIGPVNVNRPTTA